jgi:single-strand DNA-binding protein
VRKHTNLLIMTVLRNSVQLIGHLGKDVELITFESGNQKAQVSMATSETYKNAKGELVTDTQWHNLIAWGKSAEYMAKALKKGSFVAVSGSIAYRTYTTKDGDIKNITEIKVAEFIKLNPATSEKSENNMVAMEADLPF